MMTSFARRGVLLTLLGLAAGCSASLEISPELSGTQLRASGKGVLVVSARFVTATMSTPCHLMQLTSAGDGRQLMVTLATYIPFSDVQLSNGIALDPGTYVVATTHCGRGDTIYVVQPPDAARGIARFSVGAGEVVDAGSLVVTDDFKALITPYVGKSNFSAFVRPRIEPLPSGLNRELAAKLVRRPMAAIDPPPYEALVQICENQRQHAKTLWFSGGSGDPPLCSLIGPRPARTPPPKRPPGQPI